MQKETVDPPRSPAGLRWSGFVIAPLVVFSAIAIMFFFALKGDPSKLPSALIGRPAPEMSLDALAGLREADGEVPGFSTADLRRGEVTVVNFFASWCVPCVQEHPLLLALKEEAGVKVFGINYKDPPPGGRRFLGRYGNPYSAVGVDRDGRAAIEWGVYGMPESFVVTGDGRIAWKHVGPLTYDAIQKQILPVIRAARAKAGPSG